MSFVSLTSNRDSADLKHVVKRKYKSQYYKIDNELTQIKYSHFNE